MNIKTEKLAIINDIQARIQHHEFKITQILGQFNFTGGWFAGASNENLFLEQECVNLRKEVSRLQQEALNVALLPDEIPGYGNVYVLLWCKTGDIERFRPVLNPLAPGEIPLGSPLGRSLIASAQFDFLKVGIGSYAREAQVVEIIDPRSHT